MFQKLLTKKMKEDEKKFGFLQSGFDCEQANQAKWKNLMEFIKSKKDTKIFYPKKLIRGLAYNTKQNEKN